MALGTLEELREQIIDVALERAFLADPLPTDAAAFQRGWRKARAPEPDRAGGGAPGRRRAAEYPPRSASSRTASRPRRRGRRHAAQLQRLVGKRFVAHTPWARCSTCRAT
jgi:ATP-dependent helicase HrpA